jgi:uncharacterized coiled-coil DUF342 family protein
MAATSTPRPNALGRLLLRYRFALLGVSLAGALLGFLLSFGLSPSFSATAVVYAAGEEDDMRLHQGNTLILQQLFKSSYLRDTLIKKHQLQKRYGIAPDAPQAQAQTYRELADHLAIERTVFNALEITATDPDPRFAAQLANSAARLISAANDQLIRENKSQRLAILRARLKERRETYDSLLSHWKRALRQSKRDSLKALQTAAQQLDQERDQLLALRDGLIQKTGYAHPLQQRNKLLEKLKQLELDQASLRARRKDARADSVRQRKERLLAGMASEKSHLKEQIKKIQGSLAPYRSLQKKLDRNQSKRNQNRALRAALRQNPRRPLGQELSRERVKKAHAALEKHREKLRQGKEHLAHPPPAAYLASKAIAPAEPSRPLRLLWAFLGAVVLSSTTLLYYTLYHLWKGFPA